MPTGFDTEHERNGQTDRQTDRQTPHDCTGCAYAERCATKTKPDQLSLERDNHGTESSNGG